MIQSLVSQTWLQFGLVVVSGFLTGLELRGYLNLRSREEPDKQSFSFGTSRTYTFIAILGYVFAALDPTLRVYLVGLAGLLLFFALFYYHKLQHRRSGALQPLIGLLVYSYGPAALLKSPWFLILLFVSVVFILNARPLAHWLIDRIAPHEMLTLAKFLLIAGVVLPLLPREIVVSFIPASPFKIGVGVIVISAISYVGYILKKYFLKRHGYLVTGLLGGLYSSTATTVVLAKKTRRMTRPNHTISAGMIAASGVMYLRLLLLVLFINISLLRLSILPLLSLGLLTLVVAWLVDKRGRVAAADSSEVADSNPLELGTAFLFAFLFVIIMIIVILHFGKSGLAMLSFVVGFTDIDPFILSVLGGHFPNISMQELTGAILIAAGSNNILKAGYTAIFGKHAVVRCVVVYLVLLGLVSIGWGFFVSGTFLL
ncbi:MAG: DUF4010 domain-containing protein [Deltaproteobacteria bacterium]|nr:DUF4010 domain-containing protein [Deltaproteobacteria bacterium]